jgi:F0F1-type ATP synthase assembly protein I
MPQMHSSEEQYSYGQYEGNPSYTTQRQNDNYDDNFVEALAQRIAQRVPQGTQGKITDSRRNVVSAGQRLALAIVSVCMLVPLAGILMTSGVGGLLGLAAFGIACAAIFLINAVFNAMR